MKPTEFITAMQKLFPDNIQEMATQISKFIRETFRSKYPYKDDLTSVDLTDEERAMVYNHFRSMKEREKRQREKEPLFSIVPQTEVNSIEVKPSPDIEPMPTEQDLIPVSTQKLEKLETIVRYTLQKSSPQTDLVIFPHGDSYRVHICGSAALRLIRNIGALSHLKMKNVSVTREDREDEKGKYYLYVASCMVEFGEGEWYVEGVVSTRNKFFHKVRGKEKDLSEIDERNIRQAALTELYKSICSLIFGGKSFSIETCKEWGINVSLIPKVEFGE